MSKILSLGKMQYLGDTTDLRFADGVIFSAVTPTLGNYGYGLFIGKFKPAGMTEEMTSIGHHGGISGFSALLIRFAETQTTIILLDNTRAETRGNLENISLGIFRILKDLPADKLKDSTK